MHTLYTSTHTIHAHITFTHYTLECNKNYDRLIVFLQQLSAQLIQYNCPSHNLLLCIIIVLLQLYIHAGLLTHDSKSDSRLDLLQQVVFLKTFKVSRHRLDQ